MSTKAKATNRERRDFKSFLKLRDRVASAYVRGDFSPLEKITARTGVGTFFGPQGGAVKSAAKVFSRYKYDAKSFVPVGKSKLDVMHAGASGGLAYWVGVQRATAQLHGMKKPVSMNLRVTEIFRHDGRGWKMIHRHADPLVAPSKK